MGLTTDRTKLIALTGVKYRKCHVGWWKRRVPTNAYLAYGGSSEKRLEPLIGDELDVARLAPAQRRDEQREPVAPARDGGLRVPHAGVSQFNRGLGSVFHRRQTTPSRNLGVPP